MLAGQLICSSRAPPVVKMSLTVRTLKKNSMMPQPLHFRPLRTLANPSLRLLLMVLKLSLRKNPYGGYLKLEFPKTEIQVYGFTAAQIEEGENTREGAATSGRCWK